MKNHLFLILIVVQCYAVVPYKILGIFPIVSPSHYFVGRALMKGLAADGHEVTVLSPFRENKPIANYSEIYLDGIYEKIVNGDCNLVM